MVEGKELWDYVNEDMAQSYHDLFLDYTFLISRLFDARVKSFMKNILLGRGEGKVAIAQYSYRVEFQARGLPHIHGVCWIEKEKKRRKIEMIVSKREIMRVSTREKSYEGRRNVFILLVVMQFGLNCYFSRFLMYVKFSFSMVRPYRRNY